MAAIIDLDNHFPKEIQKIFEAHAECLFLLETFYNSEMKKFSYFRSVTICESYKIDLLYLKTIFNKIANNDYSAKHVYKSSKDWHYNDNKFYIRDIDEFIKTFANYYVDKTISESNQKISKMISVISNTIDAIDHFIEKHLELEKIEDVAFDFEKLKAIIENNLDDKIFDEIRTFGVHIDRNAALAVSKRDRYFAISGINCDSINQKGEIWESEYIKKLLKITNYVHLDDDTLYVYPHDGKKEIIPYSKRDIIPSNISHPFSCAEKKISSRLIKEKQKQTDFTFFLTFIPCDKCLELMEENTKLFYITDLTNAPSELPLLESIVGASQSPLVDQNLLLVLGDYSFFANVGIVKKRNNTNTIQTLYNGDVSKAHLSKYLTTLEINDSVYLLSSSTHSLISLKHQMYNDILNLEFENFKLHEYCALMIHSFITDKDETQIYKQLRHNVIKTPRERLSLTILTTTACNARCFYCFEKGVKPQRMSENVADAIISYIVNSEKDKVHISWFGGEPLLEPKIINYITQKVLDAGIKLTASMITNGYLVGKNIDTIVKSRINKIQITLDGKPDTYKLIKNYKNNDPDPFSTVLNNIKLLESKGINVSVRLNYNDENVCEILEMIGFLAKQFNNSKYVTIYTAPIYKKGKGVTLSKDTILRVFKKSLECNLITNLSHYLIRPRVVSCGVYFDETFTINSNGDFIKCSHCLGDKENMSIGNILYPNDLNQTLLNKWVDITDIPDSCWDCSILPMCQGGCRYDAIKNENGYVCPFYKHYMKDILEMYLKHKGM